LSETLLFDATGACVAESALTSLELGSVVLSFCLAVLATDFFAAASVARWSFLAFFLFLFSFRFCFRCCLVLFFFGCSPVSVTVRLEACAGDLLGGGRVGGIGSSSASDSGWSISLSELA